MSTRNRKYDSGSEKRKKKQRLEAAAQSQRGALDRFILRETPEANLMIVTVMIMLQYMRIPLQKLQNQKLMLMRVMVMMIMQ